MKIVIIGSGNVAFHLAKALYDAGHEMVQIVSRNTVEGQKLADQTDAQYIDKLEDIAECAEVYIMAISDDAIAEVAADMKDRFGKDQIIAHTAGSVSIDSLDISAVHFGSFYPLQTFNKKRALNYKEIPFCIHGNDEYTRKKLFDLASSISDNVQYISDEQRKQIHLSAVWSCNFVNHMIAQAEEILDHHDIAPDIIYPLIEETMKKAMIKGARNSQTGPAVRGDDKVLQRHSDMLESFPSAQSLYNSISKAIQEKNSK